jgi:DNA mismatch repair protein MutS
MSGKKAGGKVDGTDPSRVLTPMLQQYTEIKVLYPKEILFYRMGDFYEMFFEDAEIASKVLGIALTSRNKGENAVPMAGIPYHSATSYIERLLRAGYRVAICEQVQDPKEAKGLVEREVVEVITPGTLTDGDLLDDKENNFLLAVNPDGDSVGLAWIDLSTGKFLVEETAAETLADEVGRIDPAECLVPEELWRQASQGLRGLDGLREGVMLTPYPDWTFDVAGAYRRLLEHFSVASLEGFGFYEPDLAIGSAGAVLHYLAEYKKGDLRHVEKIGRFSGEEHLILDRTSRTCLELVETIRAKERKGSLLWVLDRTVTPMGGRLLREWILNPLRSRERIEKRQEGVGDFAGRRVELQDLVEVLSAVQDLERLSVKASSGRAHARDLIGIRMTLQRLPRIKKLLSGFSAPIFEGIEGRIDPMKDLAEEIGAILVDDPPFGLKDGGLIRPGVDPELDDLRGIASEGREWIARFQADEAERTGISSLKVGYNKVFGYYIEVTHTHREKIPSNYTRKQTLKNAERYITPELKEMETKVLNAGELSREKEYAIFVGLRERVARHTGALLKVAGALAELDCLAALARVALARRYARPKLLDERRICIREGRHPVLEAILGDGEFVPNDTVLGEEDGTILVITGPNMAGKSTYIRQVALLVLMAQIGSFVPVEEAEIGMADRIFTRVGTADELTKGLSTFMVEMNEAANILNNATERSLIILDEVGRGTSTFDGVSIAWAVSEYIYQNIGALTLFATHYHELTELALLFPGIRNYNVAVKEWKDEVIFLRKIVEGATDKSYGIHVARLAGLPADVIERAKVILSELEAATLDRDDLPKFARSEENPKKPVQLSLFSSPEERIIDQIQALDINTLTPLKALTKLNEFKDRLSRGTR